MALQSGERLGPYEIAEMIGKGGMGEVYKARDTRLDRDVALKVSAKQFSERFEREAKAIAALNHPNICTLFDVGPNYLVMELVEGPTLADKIKEGAIPLEDSLKIMRQIGAALECAHELPIIHRDLKPGNIKVKADGVVKVLDFGLAKVGSEALTESDSTLTLGATQPGAILGTPAYMAPEQARGQKVTKSIDIWAFGVIFHEMLTGERTFVGEDLTLTLASVVMKEPDLAPIPHRLKRLIKKCLEKDPRKRLHDIADVWDYLDEAEGGTESPAQAESLPHSGWKIAAASATLALVALGAWSFWPRAATPTAGAMRFAVDPPAGATITSTNSGNQQVAVSPDGRYIAFVADQPGRERTIWVRALGSMEAQRLDKTEGAEMPFWSPDSQHIGFFADNKVKRIPVSGGSPVNVADSGAGDGGTWWQDANGEGVIVFAASPTSPLQRVPASGGVPTAFTKLAEGEQGHIFPQFLPDGKRVLYFVRGNKPGLYVQEIGSEERTFVQETFGRAMFAAPNFLLFVKDGTLMAQRFDPGSLKISGEPVSIADTVRNGGGNGRNAFSVSNNGVLAYRTGGGGNQRQLSWYSRDGKSTGIALPTGPNGPIELSPDDKYAVVRRGEGTDLDLWLLELATGVFSRLTSSMGPESDVAWSPDSRRIAYAGEANGKREFRQMVIGSGKETVVFADGKHSNLEDWTQDGKQLLVRGPNIVSVIPAPAEGADQAKDGKAQVVLEAPFAVDQFQVSPDGKWVAYTSNESGASQVNVAAFPSFTSRRQISTDYGLEPRWRFDGRELYFKDRSSLAAVEVKPGATFETGPIRTLFPAAIRNASVHLYAVTRDGRFLVVEPPGVSTDLVEQLQVVVNWTELVR